MIKEYTSAENAAEMIKKINSGYQHHQYGSYINKTIRGAKFDISHGPLFLTIIKIAELRAMCTNSKIPMEETYEIRKRYFVSDYNNTMMNDLYTNEYIICQILKRVCKYKKLLNLPEIWYLNDLYKMIRNYN